MVHLACDQVGEVIYHNLVLPIIREHLEAAAFNWAAEQANKAQGEILKEVCAQLAAVLLDLKMLCCVH